MENLNKRMLQQKGYKATPARLVILDIFSKSKIPLNAENIYNKITKIKKRNNINEVTIYRTLSSLEAVGILKRVDLRKDSVYFELNKEHHHHIVCTNCETIEDFENKEVEKALGKIVARSSKFKIVKDHSLELFGLCRMCI